MADNITITASANSTPPPGTVVATKELGDGSHAQLMVPVDPAGNTLGAGTGSPVYADLVRAASVIQASPAAFANAWPMRLTDSVDGAAVDAASRLLTSACIVNAPSVVVVSAVASPVFGRLTDGVDTVAVDSASRLLVAACVVNAASVVVSSGSTVVTAASVTSLPAASVVQATPGAITAPWPVKLSDGTDSAAVTAGSVLMVTAVPTTACGLSACRSVSASNSGSVIKGSAGQVYGWYLYNDSASPRFVKLYDKATAPTVGTDAPKLTLPLPASAAANVSLHGGIEFALGIGLAATTGAADNNTGAPGANEVIANILYK